jgi:hypothetical protein
MRNLLNALRLFATESTLAKVINGSTNPRNSFALGTVVLINSHSIKAIAKFFISALRSEEFLFNFLPDFLCLILLTHWRPVL